MDRDHSLELVVDDAEFAEGPRWRDGALWFSDIGAGKVWRVVPGGERSIVVSTIGGPSGLGWTKSGDLLVASLTDATIYRVGPDGDARPFCGPEDHGTAGTNDMATAGSRSYVTCAGRTHQSGDTMEAVAARIGKIIAIEHETGAVRTVADGYSMPNGIAFSPDGDALVVAELFASRLLKFDIAPDGSLINERVLADLTGNPDGICMDAEGAVWFGNSAKARFERIDVNGKLTDWVSVPDLPAQGYACIACALGGEDGRDLFMVLNKISTPDDIFQGRALSKILKARVPIPGAPNL